MFRRAAAPATPKITAFTTILRNMTVPGTVMLRTVVFSGCDLGPCRRPGHQPGGTVGLGGCGLSLPG